MFTQTLNYEIWNDIYDFGKFLLIFKWEIADIRPQIRPREIPGKSYALAHILNHCSKFKISDRCFKPLVNYVIMNKTYFSTKTCRGYSKELS